MSENSAVAAAAVPATLPNFLTKSGFHALHSRYGFTQSQSGTEDVLNAAILKMTTKLTRAGMLQAEHEGHAGLNGSHAQKAIQMSNEIPKGIY